MPPTLEAGALGWTTRRSLPEAMLDQHPHGFEAVGPADILAALDVTGVVGDGDLDDPDLALAELGGDLGAELETLALELEGAQQIGAHDLEAGGLVGDAVPVEQVGGRGQDLVGEEVGGVHP